jgi:hypothetical protein
MKRFCPIVVFLIVGCIGDPALPIVSSTPIPNSPFSVHLGGPDTRGQFGYYVTKPNGVHYGYRPLGRLRPNQTTPAVLKSLGRGVVRIQWGDAASATYAIIDFDKQRFVEDSNQANPKDQPFTSDQ